MISIFDPDAALELMLQILKHSSAFLLSSWRNIGLCIEEAWCLVTKKDYSSETSSIFEEIWTFEMFKTPRFLFFSLARSEDKPNRVMIA